MLSVDATYCHNIDIEINKFFYELTENSWSMYVEYSLIFISVKHRPGFCRSCIYTVTLEILLSLQQFCLLSMPNFTNSANFAKFRVLVKDINRMEELFYKIFVLNDSVFCTFSCCCCFFFSEDCKT